MRDATVFGGSIPITLDFIVGSIRFVWTAQNAHPPAAVTLATKRFRPHSFRRRSCANAVPPIDSAIVVVRVL